MTIHLFLTLLTAEAALNGILTEAAKKAIPQMSSNLLALIDAILVGVLGTLIYMEFAGIFTARNMIYVIPMTIAVWIGSMVGYDKVIQTVKQIAE